MEQLGQRVPEDVSVVCFDSPIAPLASPLERPYFTHIHQDETAMGRLAVGQILAQLRGKTSVNHSYVDFHLILGRSSAAVRRSS